MTTGQGKCGGRKFLNEKGRNVVVDWACYCEESSSSALMTREAAYMRTDGVAAGCNETNEGSKFHREPSSGFQKSENRNERLVYKPTTPEKSKMRIGMTQIYARLDNGHWVDRWWRRI